ncbi:hypothetical protein I5Q34_27480 [Streptomyces sp. AV19]|uniref:DUF6083 domain-containing protein n=1 Tax=Streptomyces sp. AV19 TaxID=2793068 RepID=UPI0018FE73EB|nr:DUF6083 domain-containing protein [Streptomyces sp. AV19]MBH1937967.1 hypothetical protein [Streptomyces sp. AV19]MDG4536583.1 DUF6083 domain-containing protein [Streptomyces sp. AV19]
MGVNETNALCPYCGHGQDRRQVGRRRWILLEPEPVPAGCVPDEHRWVIGADGWAVRGWWDAMGKECRIDHRLVCSNWDSPGHPDEIFYALWMRNRDRDGLSCEG